MVGAVWHFGMLSPFNIFFYFIPRSWVVVSMPYYILVKLIGIGLSMNYVLNKWFAKLSFFHVCYLFCYVFLIFIIWNIIGHRCGWTWRLCSLL